MLRVLRVRCWGEVSIKIVWMMTRMLRVMRMMGWRRMMVRKIQRSL